MIEESVSIRGFDLPRFIEAIVAFWGDLEIAFPFVHDGMADFGTACLEDDADNVGDSPLEWLQHGQTLFAQFTRGDGVAYELADGTEFETTEGDEADDVFLDDSSTYGFLLRLRGESLTIQTAVLRDMTGEPVVQVVKHAGPFEERMRQFLTAMQHSQDAE